MKSNVVVSVFFSFAICVLTLLPRASAQDAGYPFKLQPLEIIARLSELKSEGEVAKYQTCPAELEMAKWIKEKDISDTQWADAFLIASGECDAKDRQRHLKQLDSINDKLRKSTAKLKGREFGDKLLQELHVGAMSNGYEKEQSSLAVLLDQSNFNCVSSTVMYVLQAKRLGQKVEIIEFPGGPGVDGHVMLMFLDGDQKVDVETTSKDGFDVRAKVAKGGGYSFGINDLKNGRPIDIKGLLLSVYNNRATDASKADKHLDALRMHAMMLAIAPTSQECQKGVATEFMNWVATDIEQKHFDEALSIGRLGLQICSGDEGITNNIKAAHAAYAKSLIKEQRYQEVINLYDAAIKDWPDQEYDEDVISIFASVAHEAADEGKWDNALKILAFGIENTSGSRQEAFQKALSNLYLNRSSKLIRDHDYETAITALKEALEAIPNDDDLKNNVAYLAQESLGEMDTGSESKKLKPWLDKLRSTFPNVEKISDVAQAHVYRRLQDQMNAKKFDDAHEALKQRRDLIDDNCQNKFCAIIFDNQAQALVDEEKWLEGAKVYKEAIKVCDNNEILAHNAPLLYDKWAKKAMDQKNWTEAIRIYTLGLQDYHDSSLLKNNLEYCKQQLESKS